MVFHLKSAAVTGARNANRLAVPETRTSLEDILSANQAGPVPDTDEENAQACRPGYLIEFHKKDLPVGLRVEMEIAHDDSARQMQPNGFKLAKEHIFLPYQYFLIFTLK
jgi:hypothetical protein